MTLVAGVNFDHVLIIAQLVISLIVIVVSIGIIAICISGIRDIRRDRKRRHQAFREHCDYLIARLNRNMVADESSTDT